MEPIILITADRREPTGFIDSPRVRPRRPEVYVTEAYVDAVCAAGGIPLIAPAIDADPERLLETADGLLLTGGHFDIHPSHYGEQVTGRLDRVEATSQRYAVHRRASHLGIRHFNLIHVFLPTAHRCLSPSSCNNTTEGFSRGARPGARWRMKRPYRLERDCNRPNASRRRTQESRRT